MTHRLWTDDLQSEFHVAAMDIRRQLGSNVRMLRQAKGWSQEDLSFESNLHRTYISGIERGTRNPTITIVALLARTLGVTPGRLLEPLPGGQSAGPAKRSPKGQSKPRKARTAARSARRRPR